MPTPYFSKNFVLKGGGGGGAYKVLYSNMTCNVGVVKVKQSSVSCACLSPQPVCCGVA